MTHKSTVQDEDCDSDSLYTMIFARARVCVRVCVCAGTYTSKCEYAFEYHNQIET